jgi:hypothetical protein
VRTGGERWFFRLRPVTSFKSLTLLFWRSEEIESHRGRRTWDDSVNEQITTLAQAYEQSATLIAIRASFRRAGLTPDGKSRPFRLVFDEQRLRENRGFKEIWDRNITIEDLSRRGRAKRFGIINSEFLIECSSINDD